MTENELNPFAESSWAEEPQATDSNATTESTETTETENEPESSTESTSSESESTTETTDGQEPKQSFDDDSDSYSQEYNEEDEPKLEFKNELSQKVFESIVSGNYEKVAPIIYEQTVLSNLEKLSDEEVVKLMIQYENPDMSEEDLNKEYADRYSPDIEQKDTSFMTDEEIAEYNKSIERAKKRAIKEIKKDAREAIRHLSEKKVDLELPNIQDYIKSSTSKTKDNSREIEEYNQFIQNERMKYESSIDKGLDTVKSFEMDYADDDVSFKVNFTPNKDDLSSMKSDLQSFTLDDFYGPRYYDAEKGEYKTNVLAEDMYWINNRDKIIKSIVSQAVSSTKANMLKNIKGVSISDSPSSRSTTQSTKSEFDAFVEQLYSM